MNPEDITDPLEHFSRNPDYMDSRVSMDAESMMELSQPYDANDPEQVKDQRIRLAKRERTRLDAVRKIMIMQSGRKFLWELMTQCNVFTNPIVKNDTHMTYFLLGEQSVGKKLLADCEKFTELYLLMKTENREA